MPLVSIHNDVEIIAPSFFGLVYAFDLIGNKLNTEWPMFQYNRYNTGCYPVGHSNNPPKPPIIDGPINGKPGTSYTYTFNSTDPDHNDILEYTIDWGDNTGEEIITGPYASGEEVTGSHTWTSKGTFTIKAKAKDIDGAESTWSEFQVTMPRNKAMVFSFVLRLFERFPNAFPILQFILRLY